MYTSRYGNKELRNDGYYPVGISLGRPKFDTGYAIRNQCYALAPKNDMFGREFEEFRLLYFSKLDSIGKDKIVGIVRNLERIAKAEGKELVLLCFEDIRNPENWCHRTIFAEWWKNTTGEEVKELKDDSEIKGLKKKEEAPIQQISMFD